MSDGIYRRAENRKPRWELEVSKSDVAAQTHFALLIVTGVAWLFVVAFFCLEPDYKWLAKLFKPLLVLATHWIIWALCFVRVWREVE
jgi:hypothetical protein